MCNNLIYVYSLCLGKLLVQSKKTSQRLAASALALAKARNNKPPAATNYYAIGDISQHGNETCFRNERCVKICNTLDFGIASLILFNIIFDMLQILLSLLIIMLNYCFLHNNYLLLCTNFKVQRKANRVGGGNV